MRTKWTKEEEDFLIKNYANMKTPELMAKLNGKSNDQIRWKAKDYGLKKEVSRSKSTIEFLENFDDFESCYWWGFITADGCITKKQLILSIHERDKDHLEKFCTKSNSSLKFVTRENAWHKKPYTMGRTVINDSFFLKRIINLLNIKPKKTYNPFDINIFLTPNRLCYFVAGIIDGDGYISKNKYGFCEIRVKVHSSWEENFKKIASKLIEFYEIDACVKIVKGGWVSLFIRRRSNVDKLFSLVKNCPLLQRKWTIPTN